LIYYLYKVQRCEEPVKPIVPTPPINTTLWRFIRKNDFCTPPIIAVALNPRIGQSLTNIAF